MAASQEYTTAPWPDSLLVSPRQSKALLVEAYLTQPEYSDTW
jgi:hypothetical protein